MERLFFSLIRLGIGTAVPNDEDCKGLLSLSMKQWQKVMDLADRQGVVAIAADGLQKLYDSYEKEIKAANDSPAEWQLWVLDCAGGVMQYEQRHQMQRNVIKEVSDIWTKEGIRMMVFKGQTNASFFPKPEHRATGDIDCWLFGDTDKGDDVLRVNGAEVDNLWYRHSKISYKGETIENHRVFSHTRGSRKKKAMEEELRFMVKGSRLMVIEGCGKALMPTVQFNACFLTYHGLHHFLTEGLRMKQILDWAMFLKVYQKDVDWEAYNDFCERYRLERFAAMMNYVANNRLGVQLECPGIITDETYTEKVIKSTLNDEDYLFSSGKSDWNVRWLLVKNMLGRDRWKYKDIAQENVWMHLWENAKGFVCEKNH